VLNLAADFTASPNQFISNGKNDGLDVALCQAMASQMGVTIKWTNLAFDGLIPGLHYFVQFVKPASATGFTTQTAGTDTTIDSNARTSDGATAEVNDAVRGEGSFAMAVRAMENLASAGFTGFKLSVVCTRHNIPQLDAFKAIADRYGAQLRLTRLRPSGRGADVWDELHPTAAQQRELYDWLLAHGEGVLTGDSFFHLAGYGEALPGLAGRNATLSQRPRRYFQRI